MEAVGHLEGSRLNSALANAVARIQTERLGVEPGNTTAFHNANIAVVVLHDVLNQSEKLLAQNGSQSDVVEARHRFQREMEADFSRRALSFSAGGG